MIKTKLVCLPCAGSSSVIYYEWKEYLDNSIELVLIDYPGHGVKSRLNLSHDFPDLIDSVYNNIENLISDCNYVLFGHSMGAWVAYDLYRKIKNSKKPLPKAIIFSGRNSPQLKSKDIHLIHNDKELDWESIIKLGGIPKEIIEQEKYKKYFEPIFINDFKLMKQYEFIKEKVEVNTYIFSGTKDRIVNSHKLKEWNSLCSKNPVHHRFEGGHFYCFNESLIEVVKCINKIILN